MNKPVAFSYSRLGNFEQCPKKFHAVSISKKFSEAETEQMLYGKAVHKSLELRVLHGTPLPQHLSYLEPLVSRLAGSKGPKLAEYQMCVNASLEPVSWFSKDAYCRSIADLVIEAETKAAMFDYKTGKKSDDFLQLKLTGAMLFLHRPLLETIRIAFLWTKDKSVTSMLIHRHELPEIWAALAPRIERYQLAFRENDFPPRPGWYCRNCPVSSCPNWEAR